MSDLRKAAQQALEALETCVMAMQDYQAGIGITEMFDKGERMGRVQIAALRAALAQPEPEPERKPLTEEEIAEASAGVLGLPHEIKAELARAIEQAHGID